MSGEKQTRSAGKQTLVERLKDGVVVGDGGMVSELEKRGYTKTGFWTPEACILHPEAVVGLHREFVRAGSDVIQAMNFYANETLMKELGVDHSVEEVNRAACRIAKEVAAAGGQLVCASLTSTPLFKRASNDQEVIDAYKRQMRPVIEEGVDFIMCEWFFDIREMELAIRAAREEAMTVAACMTIPEKGDIQGVSVEECAVRMAKAGAAVVGHNCAVGPKQCLRIMRRMRQALVKAGISCFLISQPIGLKTPEDGRMQMEMPEWPLACEPATLTRFDAQLYAREAYKEGVRYIGGCCYMRSQHIRAIAEEMAPFKGGRLPTSSSGLGSWGEGMDRVDHPDVKNRIGEEYWANTAPHGGLPIPSAAQYWANWKQH